MISCFKGHLQIVRRLLEEGARVNRRSAKRNTALHDCAENGDVTIAKLLFQYGAKSVVCFFKDVLYCFKINKTNT